MGKKRVLWISNPVSGKGSRGSAADIGAELRLAGYEVVECKTTPNWENDRGIYAAAHEFDVIACSGGDGTLNAVVNGLLSNQCAAPLLYIPTGTTNDLAKSLHLPGGVAESIKPLEENTSRPIDIGSFNGGQYFTYIASMGAFADISYTTSQEMKNRFGHTAYVFQGICSLPKELRPIGAVVSSENTVYEGEFLFCSISNTTSIGGMLSLQSEEVLLDDGFFEVLLIRMPRNPLELWSILLALGNKTYLTGTAPGIEFFHTSQISVESAGQVPWTLDGEFGGFHESVTVEVLPGKMQLISA